MKLYEQVAEEISLLIGRGVYPVGKRIPGTRDLVKKFNVSVSTIMQAQRLLERRGLVEARPRSGYYVRSQNDHHEHIPSQSKPSSRPALVGNKKLVLDIVQQSRRDGIIHLGAAVPDAHFLPYRALNRSISSISKRCAAEILNYSFPPGNEALRQQISIRMADAGCLVSPDEIIITNGCHEAMTLALKAVTKPGDLVAIESPTYYGILQAIDSLHLKVLEIPTHPQSGISLSALELAIEKWDIKACVVISNFSNPLGYQLSDQQKRELVALMERESIPLIEDDIYGDLGFMQQRPCAAKRFDQGDSVIYCSSFSKTITPGFRVGWVVAGKWHDQVQHQKFATSLASPTLPQMALAHFLEQGTYSRHIRKVRDIYAEQVHRMVEMVLEHFPEGTRVTRPMGGLVVWVEFPEGVDTLQIYYEAISLGISTAPGMLFSAVGKYSRCLRLNCAIKWDERTTWAVVTLGQMGKQILGVK